LNAVGRLGTIVLIFFILVLSLALGITLSLYSITSPKTSTVLRTFTITTNQTVLSPIPNTITETTNQSFTRTLTESLSQSPEEIVEVVFVTSIIENYVCALGYKNESSTVYLFPVNLTNQNFEATISASTSITTTTSYENITVYNLVNSSSSTTYTTSCLITNGPMGNNGTDTCYCV
jgi:Na+/H+-dicarboxylate symporter